MKTSTNTPVKPGCIRYTLQIMGDKWTGLILRELCASPASFSELEKSVQGISPRTLSQRLAKLTDAGVLSANEYCEKPVRCKYSLTPKGAELQGIIEAMAKWSAKHEKC